MIRIRLDTHIWLRTEELDERLARSLRNAMQFPNPEKEIAESEALYGWEDLPDELKLWESVVDGGREYLVLPRGFYARLVAGLGRERYGWEVDDARAEVVRTWDLEGALTPVPLDVKRDQPNTAERLLSFEQGILQAPPAMGKTATALEVIRRSHQRALIVVEKTNIARQWQERAMDFLGVEIGLIGDTDWEEKDITVALRQSLWARRDELISDGFFDRWGMAVYDEVHHVQADCLADIAQLLPARFRLGFSATPDRNDGRFDVTRSVIGDVVYEVPKQQLYNSGVLMKPHVTYVQTRFDRKFRRTYAFRPTKKTPTCPIDGCTRTNAHRHPNNWQQIVRDLVRDDERNAIVVDCIIERLYDRQLVLSKRLEHLDRLMEMLLARGYPGDQARMLTGEQDSEERMRVARFADASPCVVFSTIADEALDIPRMEVVHLPFPTANPAIVVQQVGRVERSAEGKQHAEVVDYVDRTQLLYRQALTRRRVYVKEGYESRTKKGLPV